MKTLPKTLRLRQTFLTKLKSLAAPDVVGFYTDCEVTAVFAIRKGEADPLATGSLISLNQFSTRFDQNFDALFHDISGDQSSHDHIRHAPARHHDNNS
jgi:hypothetical protein